MESGVSDDLEFIRELLQWCVDDGTVEEARQLVKNLTREQLELLTRQKTRRGLTPLWRAVLKRRPEFVKFLLEECFADVDQRNNACCQMNTTALCLCCCDGQIGPLCDPDLLLANLDLARILVEHGADVNAAQNDEYPPVTLACEQNQVCLVQYLVQHGADIDATDVAGKTCVMNSILNGVQDEFELARWLIEQGASVNAVDNLGDTALHYAVGYKPLVAQLLQYGADPSICNQFGNDVLQHTALYGSRETLEYLIGELQPTLARQTDLYSLKAAQTRDRKCWKKSISVRAQIPPGESTAGDVVHGPHPVFNGAVEARDLESLEAIRGDEDAQWMQALVCFERILGRGHVASIHGASKRALRYVQSDDYERGIKLYRYAAQSCSLSSVRVLWDVKVHGKLLDEITKRYFVDVTSVRFEDATDIMWMYITDMGKNTPAISSYWYTKDCFARRSVDILDLLTRLRSSNVQSQSLKQMACALVQSLYQTGEGNAIHYAVSQYRPIHDASFLPSITLLQVLLEAGADINALDSRGDTPLHLAVIAFPDESSPNRAGWLDVIDLLLRHGAHIDIPNGAGEIAADQLPPTLDVMKHTTLQCLAARTIRKHGVEYRNILPTSLADFVKLH